MEPSKVNTPPLKNLTIENITENVHLINSGCPDPRLRYVLERLVAHLHDFARETRLSTAEWTAGLEFLAATGQTCTDVRQEFILLSDVLGLSLLVDSIDHPKPAGATAGTVLGPFHTHDAPIRSAGDVVSRDPDGTPCLVVGSVRDSAGRPLEGVTVDVWQADSKGFYDVQYAGRTAPDGRAVLETDHAGHFWFRATVPAPYPIPHDGPVGELLRRLRRHPWRPSHMHFMFYKEGYDNLITSLYIRGDPYEQSDAVFGVKESLIVDLERVTTEQVHTYGVKNGSRCIAYDFVLVSSDRARSLREDHAVRAMEAQGRTMKLYNSLPVPDVD